MAYGNLLFIAGVGAHVEGDIKSHTKIVLDSIQQQLESVGSSMEKVLKCNVYLNDLKDWPAMNESLPGPLRAGTAGAHHHRRRRRNPRQLAGRDRRDRLHLR